jgi:ankyrin repeat protein
MEANVKMQLGDKLYDACRAGTLNNVLACIALHREKDPSYRLPLSAMMYVSVGGDNEDIVRYCLDNGGCITESVMRILLIARATKTFKLFNQTKGFDIDFFIPWFGDILSNVAMKDDYEWTELCLKNGADPNLNLIDEYKTVLAAVAESSSVKIAKLLIEHGADVKFSKAIVLAAQEGKLDMVQLLIENGADIDVVGIEHPTDERFTEDMASALFNAVRGGHLEVARYLLEMGANVNVGNINGKTPLSIAREKNYSTITELLLSFDARF